MRKLYESTNTAAYVHMAFLSATCALVVGMLVKEPLPRALAAAVSLLNVVVAVGVGRTSSQRPVASAESTALMDAKEPVHVVPSKMGCESDGDKTVVGFVGVMNDGKLRPLEAKDFAAKKGKEAYEAAQKKAQELSKIAQEKGCCIIQ